VKAALVTNRKWKTGRREWRARGCGCKLGYTSSNQECPHRRPAEQLLPHL